MLYILDTDHISLLQRRNANVIERLQQLPLDQRAVTAISLAEQIQGRMVSIRRAQSEADVSRAFQLLIQTVEFFRTIQMLPYNSDAVAEFERLRRAKIRVGTQDLRIAAIALSRRAVIVTRNRRDFDRVPNLSIESWD